MIVFRIIIIFLFFTSQTLSAQNSDSHKELTNVVWKMVNNNDWFKSDSLIFTKSIPNEVYYDGVKIILTEDGTIETSYLEPTVVDAGFHERKRTGNWALEDNVLTTTILIIGNRTKFKIQELNGEKLVLLIIR